MNHQFLYQLVELGMLKLNQIMVFFKLSYHTLMVLKQHSVGYVLIRSQSSFLNPLKGKVEKDIAAGYKRQGNNPRDLPQLPQFVGGDTDFIKTQISSSI